jgi:hypothetical protein
MQVIAMGQFEQMIRYDAQLRNHGRFSIFTHPTAHDDSLAVIYVEARDGDCVIMNATRLNVLPLTSDNAEVTRLIQEIGERHKRSFINGLLAITARSERYTASFTNQLKSDPLSALRRVIDDPSGYDIEYQSYDAPQAMKMVENKYLNEAAKWIQDNNGSVRSYITFNNGGKRFMVLGRQFREESFMMLSSYNPSKQMAYFDAMISGRPVHQRVDLNPTNFQGDKIFVDTMAKGNIVSEYGTLWRIRHLGFNQSENGEWYLRGPHIAGRNPRTIPRPEERDVFENRIIIL